MSSRRHFIAGASALACASVSGAAKADEAPPLQPPPAPTLYLGHGGPNLASNSHLIEPLRQWGGSLPDALGVVAITPHVRADGVELSAIGPGRPLISFPRRFLPNADRFSYDTPDSTALAAQVESILSSNYEVSRRESTGLNHTVWMPLMHLVPEANVPVVQLALPYAFSDRSLFELGQSLAPLRDQGVWIMASGNLTHNLGQMRLGGQPGWVREFDAWIAERLSGGDVDAIVDWRSAAPNPYLAHPDDGGHFDVMLVALGAASRSASPHVTFPVEGFSGSMSDRAIQFV